MVVDNGRWLQGWKDVLNVMYNIRRNGGDLGNQLLIILEFGEALGLLTLCSEMYCFKLGDEENTLLLRDK